MKKFLSVNLLLIFLVISACSTGNNPSVRDRFVKNGDFVFGRIKIYQVYDEKKMRDISSRCYINDDPVIEQSALSDIGLNWKRFNYFFEHGLVVFKQRADQDLFIAQINCDDYGFKRNRGILLENERSSIIVIRDIKLLSGKSSRGIKYFGDIDIFISSEADDKKVVNESYRGSRYPLHSTLFYDKSQIFISDNLDETYDYLIKKFSDAKIDKSKISYQPMKIMEKNEVKKIPQSKKKMPF